MIPNIYVYNKKDNSVEEITGISALEILASMEIEMQSLNNIMLV